MKYALYAFLASTALMFASAASATVTIAENTGQLATHVKADDKDDGDPTTRYGSTGTAPSNVLFDADTEIRVTGGGFALVEDNVGVEDFYQLIVNPDENFTAIDFSLQFIEDAWFTIEYSLASAPGAFVLLSTISMKSDNLKDYLMTGDAGEVFDAIRLTSVTGSGVAIKSPIDFEKQNSLTLAPVQTPVPEPSTWAMMLLGFAGIGGAIRHTRRKKGAALLQIA